MNGCLISHSSDVGVLALILPKCESRLKRLEGALDAFERFSCDGVAAVVMSSEEVDPVMGHDLDDGSAATLSCEPGRRHRQRRLRILPLSLNAVLIASHVVLQGRPRLALDVIDVVQWVVEEFVHMATQGYMSATNGSVLSPQSSKCCSTI